jgi:hypothetical protein
MRYVAFVVIGAMAVGPLNADIEILPISGVDYLNYDMETGTVTPASVSTRYGHAVWSCPFDYVNYFVGASEGEMWLDWADISGPVPIGGFSFGQYTNSQAADGDLYAMIAFYAEEDGRNSTGRVLVALYRIDNIPGSDHTPYEYWGQVWGVDLATPFVLDGSDLDSDGLTDWGYAQYFSIRTPGALHGPPLCGLIDPNNMPESAPGVEDAIDLFQDPNWNVDPNLQTGFVGTYWMSGPCQFAQFYFELYVPECPNAGESGRYCHGDIDGSFDCIVGLADLAVLLSNYGLTTGATPLMGDVDPCDEWFPGDGDVDLADLAELLKQYGDDCNWP